jgi:hypothetical protein
MDTDQVLTITNKKIVQFYKKNTHINFEKINEIIIELFIESQNNLFIDSFIEPINNDAKDEEAAKDKKARNDVKDVNVVNQINVVKDVNDTNNEKMIKQFIDSHRIPSLRGQLAENYVENILEEMFLDAEIIRSSKDDYSGDITLKRRNKETILFEVKFYNKNIPKIEVDKFIRDINHNNYHGIMVSYSTGISSRYNFEIEIINKKICIYIHTLSFNKDKIKTAIDIIDNLSCYVIKDHNDSLKNKIEEINNEYQDFINRKKILLNHLKESNKKTIQMIDNISFPNLNKYLLNNSNRAKSDDNICIICDICNTFEAKNNKSLSQHKRFCKGDIKV